MKKYLLVIICLFSLPVSILRAQDFTAPQCCYSYYGTLSNPTPSCSIPITNTNHNPIDVAVTKFSESLAQFHSTLFCFGTNCFDTSVATSSVISFAGQDTQPLLADLNTNGALGSSCTTYRIYAVANPGDFVDVVVCFNITVTGIKDINQSSTITIPSPNPADKFTFLNYDLQGNYKNYKVAVYNILGNLVQENNFSNNKGLLMLSTAEQTSGVYFYSLMEGNKVISTNKLVVAHKN